MREYRIRITGEYDVLVVSPRMLERLIARIRQSDSRELVIPAEEILPPGYTDYLSRVLEANGEQDGEKSGQNVYDVLAGQIENLKVEEDPCFAWRRSFRERSRERGRSLTWRPGNSFFFLQSRKIPSFAMYLPTKTARRRVSY